MLKGRKGGGFLFIEKDNNIIFRISGYVVCTPFTFSPPRIVYTRSLNFLDTIAMFYVYNRNYE